MDIISHGLWGSITFGRHNKKSFWLSFFLGIGPDFFAFGLFFLSVIAGLASRPDFSHEPPHARDIPSYIYHLYNISHSLVVFIAVFFLIWAIRRRPLWEFLAWGLHILLDIPTHSYQFFPTPFLWPLSGFQVNGIPWSRPEIFVPNVILLVGIYGWFFVKKRIGRTKKFS